MTAVKWLIFNDYPQIDDKNKYLKLFFWQFNGFEQVQGHIWENGLWCKEESEGKIYDYFCKHPEIIFNDNF